MQSEFVCQLDYRKKRKLRYRQAKEAGAKVAVCLVPILILSMGIPLPRKRTEEETSSDGNLENVSTHVEVCSSQLDGWAFGRIVIIP